MILGKKKIELVLSAYLLFLFLFPVGAIFGQLGKVFALESAEIGWTFTIVALGMVGNLSYTFAVK